MKKYLYIGLVLLLAACSSDQEEQALPQGGVLQLTSSVSPFDGEGVTRTIVAGNAFENNDKI